MLAILTSLAVFMIRAPLSNSLENNQTSIIKLASMENIEKFKGEYIAGELIVKFKQEGEDNITSLDISQRIIDILSLRNLHEKWRVKSYEPVFKSA
jgi:hypothetical protein